MNVLLTRGNINNNVFLYLSTQMPSATELRQTKYSRLTLLVFDTHHTLLLLNATVYTKRFFCCE